MSRESEPYIGNRCAGAQLESSVRGTKVQSVHLSLEIRDASVDAKKVAAAQIHMSLTLSKSTCCASASGIGTNNIYSFQRPNQFSAFKCET